MGLLLMTRFTIQEVLRKRLFLAVLILSLIFITGFALLLHTAMTSIFYTGTNKESVSQFDLWSIGVFMSIPASWFVHLLSCILTIFAAVNMISGEIEAGTFVIIVPKPLHRYEIVLGKWLGYALLLTAYTAGIFFGFLSVIYWSTGYWPSQSLSALGTLELSVLSLLGLTTLGSVLFPTVVNGAIMLILFIGAPVASFVAGIVQFTATIQNHVNVSDGALQNMSTVVNLIIPTDALWHGTSYYLLPTVAMTLLGPTSSFFSLPIISAQQVTTALLVWIACYIILFPLLAAWRFQKRDL
ncbi:ABC transporter permease subunit [Tengunoibacter tsumagoiensis]|uniref:ABC transporter permease n=1 Tax=Tengunoibacter tsumagoiensis TaxID=2014871 RepID=A0A402A6I8_9CHLR|nr:ABC transporter permease subunit [Tengunoibacter tsumagoiensis]GCE14750.1 hypothetical protein KTT_46090 [Tengunoibacter tsumagoiensis]